MTIKVLTVDTVEWNENNIQRAIVLGEYANENEALTEIWRDLVEKRQSKAYLLFQKHRWIRLWRRPKSIVWGGLHKGMPRIYQEGLDALSEKKASKIYQLAA